MTNIDILEYIFIYVIFLQEISMLVKIRGVKMKSLKKLVVLLLILSLFAMVGCSSGQEAEQQGEDQNQVEQESDQQQAEETNLLVFSGAGPKNPWKK